MHRRSVAIVGMGPRGLAVLERLLIRLRRERPAEDVVIWAVDPVEHGPGRVWRSDQPEWLIMNATASEVTVRSPDSHLPGGPHGVDSLSTWAADAAGPLDAPPRKVYGDYLRDVFHRLCASVPPGAHVRPVLGEATRLRRTPGGMVLDVGVSGPALRVDKVVLATGHDRVEPTEEQRALLAHAHRHPGCRYLWEGMVAEMALDDIPPATTVAVRGLGLTFYDLVRSFSTGRGGTFVRDQSGRLRYQASGQEPRVVAGSRGGLPFLARPRLTQQPDTSPQPTIMTERRLARVRARAVARRGSPQLDFAREVEPLIWAEAQRAHDECAARLGLGDQPPLDLDAVGRPFDGQHFESPTAFRHRLLDVLRTDVEESRKGPLGSPLKAGLEMLRNLRPALPAVVDFGGLLPSSHRDFLARFEPLSYVLSAGPPDAHVEELVALVEAGVVEVVGPDARFRADEERGGFAVDSRCVAGSLRRASTFIEARVPANDVTRSASPLIRRLLAEGAVSEYVNIDVTGRDRFPTGGLAVTPAPFHVIDACGRPDPDVYAVGVAADRTRWFTQVGTGRPGLDSPFCRDADAIAADVLGRVAPRRREVLAEAAVE